MKLKQDRFSLNIRQKFLVLAGIAAQRSCGAPSLEALKARLVGALGSVRCWGAALPMARGGTGWALRSLPTQTVPWFYDSVILCLQRSVNIKTKNYVKFVTNKN